MNRKDLKGKAPGAGIRWVRLHRGCVYREAAIRFPAWKKRKKSIQIVLILASGGGANFARRLPHGVRINSGLIDCFLQRHRSKEGGQGRFSSSRMVVMALQLGGTAQAGKGGWAADNGRRNVGGGGKDPVFNPHEPNVTKFTNTFSNVELYLTPQPLVTPPV